MRFYRVSRVKLPFRSKGPLEAASDLLRPHSRRANKLTGLWKSSKVRPMMVHMKLMIMNMEANAYNGHDARSHGKSSDEHDGDDDYNEDDECDGDDDDDDDEEKNPASDAATAATPQCDNWHRLVS